MLFFLAMVSTCVASETPCPPQCRVASRLEDLPTDIRLKKPMGDIPLNSWLVCNGFNGTIPSPASSPIIPCMGASKSKVAVIGYPFGVLRAGTLASYRKITILALLKGEITDIEDNALIGLTTINRLDLAFNRLVRVKQSWFSGLANLNSLDLSNNQIVRVDPGCFKGLSNLRYLYLNGNLIEKVEPDWFIGLNKLDEINLESNCIEVIAEGTFEHLPGLDRLGLGGNGLSQLDGRAFWVLSSLIALGNIGARPDTGPDAIEHDLASWSIGFGLSGWHSMQDVSVKVANRLLCVTNGNYHNKQTLRWAFDPPTTHDHTESCGWWAEEITRETPFVVMIQRGSLDPHTDNDDRCRQAWGGVGLTLALFYDFNLRLVSFWERNAKKETLAMTFDRAHSTNAGSENPKRVTCFLLKKDSSSRLVFDVRGAQNMLNKTHSDPYGVCKDRGGGLTSQRTPARSTVLPGQQTTLSGQRTTLSWQQTTLPGQQTTMSMSGQQQQTTLSLTTYSPTSTIRSTQDEPSTTTSHLFILLMLASVLALLPVLAIIVALLLKKCCSINHLDTRVSQPRVKVSRRARPTSLPVVSHGSNRQLSTRRSLPSSLSTIEAVYCEITDDEVVSAAQRPLPALPHTYWDIPDDGKVLEHGVSCRSSLPASLCDIEPAYGEIPDEDDDRLVFYAAATDLTVLGQNGESSSTCVYDDGAVRQNQRRGFACVYHDGVAKNLPPHKSTPSGHVGVYGRGNADNSHGVTFYGNVEGVSLDQIRNVV
ncbi:PREDICTED: uncharacterized protein LOC109473427 [Branchiostoma belcheri]|uniref:Uncharacterized protein LOC109473427 n=1 Tax=Branchiostoma belcheri TaxID=7741 RepID=A0A6P4YHQ6_BRABE|nr:PREDICTED: uncharacterized protein LOC109473427 [Branchiostoma belcheri]